MQIKSITLGELVPAYRPELATKLAVKLPIGGPIGVGGKYSKGTVLGCYGGTAANEVKTLTITGSPTGGTFTISYVADKAYITSALAYNASAATVKTALEGIFGTGNVTVSLNGAVYTVTFVNALAYSRIGGNLTVSNAFTGGTSPAIAWAVDTAGSAGAGQFGVYDNSSPGVARCILAYDTTIDPVGGLVTEGQVTNQPYAPIAYFTGFFKCSDLTGLDSSATADPGFRLVTGAAITDTGAVLGLGV